MPEQAQSAACRYLAARGGASLGRFGGGLAGGFFGPAGAAAGQQAGAWIGGGAGAALGALWCPDSDPRGGEWPLIPATTGQCPTRYIVNIVYTGLFNGTESGATATIEGLLGPIGGTTVSYPPAGGLEITIQTGDGVQLAISRGGPAGSWTNVVVQSVTATRIDGLPDNCGPSRPTLPNVPGDIPPIEIDPFAINIVDVDINFGNGITIPITGPLILTGPTFVGGNLALGFNFDGLDFNLLPNGTINIGGGRDIPPGGDTPPDPEDTTNYEFAGVAYTVTNAANNQSYDQVEQGRFYYPRFGSISFKGKGIRSEQFPMHGQTGYILNPEPSLFSSFTFTPYRATNTADFLKVGKSNCCKVVSYTVSQ